ncbi:MAG: GGDEF domain-containing protein, partial [Pseudomonadota bacterium]
VETVADILGHAGVKLAVQMLGLGPHNLKGVAVPLGDGGVLINLSLGAGVAEIVAKRDLKNKDFSPADPTVEMLYMFEVQAVLMRESKNLNLRLQGQKTVAEEQAYTDSLTGLANRRALQNHLARLLRRNRGDGFAVMQIDLDFFKAVNDTHGHAAGDFVLREVSQVLLDVMRATDMVARIGGDEFVVVLPEYGCREALELVGNRIIERVRQPILFEGIECRVGASIGATIVPVGCRRGPETVLSDADRALYRSKEQGRGRYNLDIESSAPTGGPEVAQ